MAYPMFMLTPMTGKEASTGRTLIVSGVEIGYKTLTVAITFGLPALFFGLFLIPLIGSMIVVLPFISIAFGMWLTTSKSRQGLKLTRYKEMNDRRKAAVNQFYVCGQPVQVGGSQFVTLAVNTVPVPGADAVQAPDFRADDLLGAGALDGAR